MHFSAIHHSFPRFQIIAVILFKRRDIHPCTGASIVMMVASKSQDRGCSHVLEPLSHLPAYKKRGGLPSHDCDCHLDCFYLPPCKQSCFYIHKIILEVEENVILMVSSCEMGEEGFFLKDLMKKQLKTIPHCQRQQICIDFLVVLCAWLLFRMTRPCWSTIL